VSTAKRGKPSKGEERALTKEIILSEALALIDEIGLEQFSVRALAVRLSVFPAAIRWWIPNRDELLGELVNYIYRDIGPFPEESDWKSWIKQLFIAHREVIRGHPNIAPLLASQLMSNMGADLSLVESILRVLLGAGFKSDKLFQAYDIVIAGSIGFVAMEFASAPSDKASEFEDRMRQKIEGAAHGDLPLINRYKDELINRHFIVRWKSGSSAPMDESFEAFSYSIVEGLRQLLTR